MTTPISSPAASGAKPAQAPPPSRPFKAGTIRTAVTDGYQQALTLSAATQQFPQYSPTPNAYLRGLWLQCVAVSTANAATVAFTGDGPWNVLTALTFQDANQKPIVGPFASGYQLMLVNKFGGYFNNGEPRASAIYSATTGSGGSGGSFTFMLYVPLEIASRDGLGALQNKSASSAFQFLASVNTEATVYSTSPTNPPVVTLTILEDGYLQPKAADATGNPLAQAPPQLGSTQYWTVGTYGPYNGSQQVQLTQGLGYPVRNFFAVNYDVSNSTRATGDADFPTQSSFIFRGTNFWNVTKTFWKDQMSRHYGYNSTTADASWGLENGVYVMPFNNDFDNTPGDELRLSYLPSQQGDQFQYIGTFNGNSNLQWIANYVAPIAGPQNLASIQAQ